MHALLQYHGLHLLTWTDHVLGKGEDFVDPADESNLWKNGDASNICVGVEK